MKDTLKKINSLLDIKNLVTILNILDEIYVHPEHEYIEVSWGSWRGFFGEKSGLIIDGAYSGKKECKNLVTGLNQLGSEGWKVINCKLILRSEVKESEIYKTNKYKDARICQDLKTYQEYESYYYDYTYFLERKKTYYYSQFCLDVMNDSSKVIQKSPVANVEEEEKLEKEILDDYNRNDDSIVDSRTIKKLHLSHNTYYCLRKAGIKTVDDLYNYSQQDLLKIKGIGWEDLETIVYRLETYFEIELPES